MRVRRHHHWPPRYNYEPEPPRGRLLLFIAAAFCAPAAAAGFCLLTALPYWMCLLFTLGAIALQLMLLFEARYAGNESLHPLYWLLAFILLLLTAYGIFGFSLLGAAAATDGQTQAATSPDRPPVPQGTANGAAEQQPAEAVGTSLGGFIMATLAQNGFAFFCWFVALLIQIVIYLSCPEYDFWE